MQPFNEFWENLTSITGLQKIPISDYEHLVFTFNSSKNCLELFIAERGIFYVTKKDFQSLWKEFEKNPKKLIHDNLISPEKSILLILERTIRTWNIPNPNTPRINFLNPKNRIKN